MSKNIFKKKPYKRIEVGGRAFIADFYVDEKKADVNHNYLHIHTPNNSFEQRVIGYPYGYLLAAVNQGKEEEVHNYCVLLWRVSQEIYQDAGLAADIIKAFGKYDKRLLKRAEKEAANISEAQNEADTAFMQSVVEYAEADPKRRKEIQAEDKAILKDVISSYTLDL